MPWHDSWTQMRKKKQPQPQGEARKRAAVAKRETPESTAAEAGPNKKNSRPVTRPDAARDAANLRKGIQ